MTKPSKESNKRKTERTGTETDGQKNWRNQVQKVTAKILKEPGAETNRQKFDGTGTETNRQKIDGTRYKNWYTTNWRNKVQKLVDKILKEPDTETYRQLDLCP